MDLEIRLADRTSKVHLLSNDGSKFKIAVDDHVYEIDALMVENGVYSILYQGESHNLELIKGDDSKQYQVNTLYHSYEIEIIDAQTKYLRNRSGKQYGANGDTISSPMPGKVVKIPVKVGEKLNSGDVAIIVEAMKMQSEYKVSKDCKIKEISVKEGDTVSANQVLIRFEDIPS
jgi:biotin carboxyl carrier protein